MDEPEDNRKPHAGWTPAHHARYSATMDRKRIDLIAGKQKQIADLLAQAQDPARFFKPSVDVELLCMRGHSLAPPNGVPKYDKAGALVQTVCKACNALRAQFKTHGLKVPRPEKAICKYGHALTPANVLVFPPTAARPKERRMCKFCYERRNRENGRKRYIPHPRKPPTLLERLEKFTRKTGDHWYWTGANDALTFEGKRRTMRRWWLQAHNGKTLQDRSQMIVMACADAKCINPAHYKVVSTCAEMSSRSHHMHEAVAALSPEERESFHRRRGDALRQSNAAAKRKPAREDSRN